MAGLLDVGLFNRIIYWFNAQQGHGIFCSSFVGGALFF